MNHYPFRSWILDEADLNDTQREELQAHLELCPECAQLSRSLSIALQTVREAHEQAAPPDFTRRFMASLEARQREQERKQARTLTLVLAATALIIVMVSLYIFVPELSLISLAATTIAAVVGLLTSLQQALSFVLNAFQKLSPSTLIISGVILAGWVLLASLTLGLSIWKLAFRKSEVRK
ncbi:MAG TPA: hypothetical protein PKK59_04390 [Anaerolineaceae bacterium]|nr:hypothetical protein [Anaerolineaceae bacterium]